MDCIARSSFTHTHRRIQASHLLAARPHTFANPGTPIEPDLNGQPSASRPHQVPRGGTEPGETPRTSGVPVAPPALRPRRALWQRVQNALWTGVQKMTLRERKPLPCKVRALRMLALLCSPD